MASPIRNNMVIRMIWMLLGLLALSTTVDSSAMPTAASSAAAATYTVNAGIDGFSFSPNTITANVGDIVTFIFYPQNHSVARAEYGFPCIPYENTGAGKKGFWSGFEPVAQVSENQPRFSVRVNSTEPIFFYCSADGACVPNGMIGVINPNATQSFDNQLAWQKNATIQLSPGQQNPSESTPTPSSPASVTASPSSAPSSSSGSSLSGGAIAGIVVGALAVIGLAGLAFYLCGRNRSLASVLRYSQPPARSRNVPPVPYSPSPLHTPYSPEFSPKPGFAPSARPAGLNPHDSWQTQATAPGMRPISPEMAGHGAMMSPNSFNTGFNHNGYNPVDNPGNMTAYHGQPSPTQNGYGQPQYAQVQQNHELASGQEPSPGMSSPGFHQQEQQPVELDARSSVPETPGAAPPQYAARTFSFSAGGEAPPGVEKVLRD